MLQEWTWYHVEVFTERTDIIHDTTNKNNFLKAKPQESLPRCLFPVCWLFWFMYHNVRCKGHTARLVLHPLLNCEFHQLPVPFAVPLYEGGMYCISPAICSGAQSTISVLISCALCCETSLHPFPSDALLHLKLPPGICEGESVPFLEPPERACKENSLNTFGTDVLSNFCHFNSCVFYSLETS